VVRKTVSIALGLLFVLFESAFFSFFPMEFSKPDPGIPFVIYATFVFGPLEGLVTAVLFGYVQEFLSNGPHGGIIFTKVCIFLSCMFLRSRLYIESRHTFALISACFVLLEAAVFLALSLFAKGETKNIMNIFIYSIPNALFTGFLALFIFTLMQHHHVGYVETG
jgi:rod shape-determining protein MreD